MDGSSTLGSIADRIQPPCSFDAPNTRAVALATPRGSPQARETAGELGLRLAQARGDYERHLIRQAELHGQREDILGIGSVTADDIQGALKEGEVLLEYLVTPEWLSVFVITNSELRVAQRDISVENLTSRIRLAREFLAQPDAGGREGPVLERLYTRSFRAP